MAEGKDLLQVLWNGADILRGKMDANEYKNYILGFIFYKYLSEKIVTFLNKELEQDELTFKQAYETDDEYKAFLQQDGWSPSLSCGAIF